MSSHFLSYQGISYDIFQCQACFKSAKVGKIVFRWVKLEEKFGGIFISTWGNFHLESAHEIHFLPGGQIPPKLSTNFL